jgi:hypothetical protein
LYRYTAAAACESALSAFPTTLADDEVGLYTSNPVDP